MLAFRLEFHGEYTSLQKDISVCMMPISHGSNPVQYLSSAFFIKHEPTGQELLFFGDVEPDSVAANPLTINVWSAAAPKIPQHLKTIFIECSYPSGRPDDQLYGHLTPEHLVQELENLAKEVLKFRAAATTRSTESSRQKQIRKRQRLMANLTPSDVKGVLKGVRVVLMHFKEDMSLNSDYEQPMHLVISEQVRKLVDQKALGVEIATALQGDRIGENSIF